MIDKRFLLLDPRDNVVVARGPVARGDTIQLDASVPIMAVDVPTGHKIARGLIRSGDRIIKYGAPIGIATADIAAGEHVHVHNVRSDYIANTTRGAP